MEINVWGSRVRPPNANRALAAFLLGANLMGRTERRVFERVVEPGNVVVEVGANQGIFTLLFSKLVGESGRVIALEPEPSLFAALEGNCRLNDATNVTRLNSAAGEERSQGFLQCSRFNSGDNRVTRSGAQRHGVAVEIDSLDNLIQAPAVAFVKIDVQGYELHVLRGMKTLVSANPSVKVFFEYFPAGLAQAGTSPENLLRFFEEHGFSLFDPSPRGLVRVEANDVARTTGNGHLSWRNFLAVRQ
jgi:FkbM family methyltransferase